MTRPTPPKAAPPTNFVASPGDRRGIVWIHIGDPFCLKLVNLWIYSDLSGFVETSGFLEYMSFSSPEMVSVFWGPWVNSLWQKKPLIGDGCIKSLIFPLISSKTGSNIKQKPGFSLLTARPVSVIRSVCSSS